MTIVRKRKTCLFLVNILTDGGLVLSNFRGGSKRRWFSYETSQARAAESACCGYRRLFTAKGIWIKAFWYFFCELTADQSLTSCPEVDQRRVNNWLAASLSFRIGHGTAEYMKDLLGYTKHTNVIQLPHYPKFYANISPRNYYRLSEISLSYILKKGLEYFNQIRSLTF